MDRSYRIYIWVLRFFLLSGMVSLFFLCRNPGEPQIRTTHDNSRKENIQAEKFIADATEISMEEIEQGKLAEHNGVSEDVKDLGRIMENGHRKLFDELRDIAYQKSLPVPAGLSYRRLEELNQLTESIGANFDRQYCTMLLDRQKQSVQKFKAASEEMTDVEIKDWAKRSLGVLKYQLDKAIICNQSARTGPPR